jgi:hypothetical protein
MGHAEMQVPPDDLFSVRRAEAAEGVEECIELVPVKIRSFCDRI